MQFDLFKSPDEKEQPSDTQICIDCGQEKPLSEYYAHPHYTNNIFKYCKSCHLERNTTAYYLKKTAPPKKGICDCCGKETESLHLDHDHTTKKFRGWLCRTCNVGLGNFYDNIQGLEMAIRYLRRHDASI
jgi:nitrate/TMAO reductase-like tetraheme cytochrome c subunit